MSASAYGPFDRAQHVGVPRPPAAFAERLAEVRPVVREAALPRLWRELPLSTRTILVYLAVNQKGEPNRIARQTWDAFSRVDQEAIASTARQVVVDLAQLAAVA